MKTIVAIMALAAAASAQATIIVETPIANPYSLGTLTTDTGDANNFRDGMFLFTVPIPDFKGFKISTEVDLDGRDAQFSYTILTDGGNFVYGVNSINAGTTTPTVASELPPGLSLLAIHFELINGSQNAHYVDFPTTFTLARADFLPEPPREVPDTGSSSALLGIGALGLATIKRKMIG